jgi:hypothetical protein
MRTAKVKRQNQIHLVISPALAEAIDQWRHDNRYFGTRQDVIRRVLDRALLDKGKAKAAA